MVSRLGDGGAVVNMNVAIYGRGSLGRRAGCDVDRSIDLFQLVAGIGTFAPGQDDENTGQCERVSAMGHITSHQSGNATESPCIGHSSERIFAQNVVKLDHPTVGCRSDLSDV